MMRLSPLAQPRRFVPALLAGAAVAFTHVRLAAQEASPQPGAETSPPAPPPPAEAEPLALDAHGRRIQPDEPTVLAFKNVSVEQVIPFIVEATGKVVLPQQDVLSRRITLLNDQPIPRAKALDLVFLALQQNGIAVVETDDLVLLRDIAELDRQDVPVLGPDESVLGRTDVGAVVEKIFALQHASAENLGEILEEAMPDFAKLAVDAESNQLVIRGHVGLLQRMERVIRSLDKPNAAALATETFHLRYADATQVAQNIRDLYTADAQRTGAGGGQNRQNPFQQMFQQRGGATLTVQPFPGGQQGGGGGAGGRRGQGRQGDGGQGAAGGAGAESDQAATSQNLRVTANTQQNSVTVLAERSILDSIRRQIETSWDRPLPEEAVVPRIYELKNSDPVKVRDLLEGLFGTGSSTAGTGAAGGGGATTQGVGRLAGQFSFEAIPEAGRLVVVSKSPDNIAVIDKIIEGLDQPQTIGLPKIVELKHASAEDLAEQLNALLAQEGTLAQIRRAESGLSEDSSNASPFAATPTQTQTQTTQQTQTTTGNIAFWWQQARPPTTSSGTSNLVGRIRIVPVWRQNAVMVMAPPEYQSSVVQLIETLDRPGRQVLISAIIAEISIDDATALGLRWSSSDITPTNPDNSISIGSTTTGQQDDFIGDLFNTSVLDVTADLNVILQALAQKTAVSILSEPRIFTGDNQEAEFFDGQDIPFITDSQTTDNGSLIQSTEYRAVGIQLRVRPRITVKRDVDLRINLELSSIQPSQTLFGAFLVDRRETTTQVIVRDGQTVVISGILRSEDAEVKRKVPLLGDIPLIGLLFQSTETEKTNTELIAFITPIVVENPDEVDSLNEQYRDRLDQLRTQIRPPEPPRDGPTPSPPPAPPTPLITPAAPADQPAE